MTAPKLTVVVPTYRRPRLLARCVAALAAQDLDRNAFEVVVVDDGSGDATDDVLDGASAGPTTVVPVRLAQNRGPAAARNEGVRRARAPLVLFLDDDVVATPDLLRAHVSLHADGDVRRAVLGRVAWHPSLRVTPFMAWLDAAGLQFAYETWLRPGPVDPPYGAFYTANLSLARALLEDAGGFDERFPYAAYEDMELAWRLTALGMTMEYRPEALAYHARPMRLRDYRARMTRVAESAALLRAAQPDFPLDDSDVARWDPGRKRRVALALLAPLAHLAGARSLLARRYQAELGAAYRIGSTRRSRTGQKISTDLC